MARPALIAAILLPLPFAALPLFAVLFSGPASNPLNDTAYAPITGPIIGDEDVSHTLAQTAGVTIGYDDDLDFGCQDVRTES